MTGAIIGDLAAWTWEHDKETFYKQLVSEEARLSICGMSVLAYWEKGRREPYFQQLEEPLKACFLEHASDFEHHPQWMEAFLSQFGAPYQPLLAPLLIAGVDLTAWQYQDKRGRAFDHGASVDHLELMPANVPELEKSGLYTKFLTGIIYRLLQGATKKEALNRPGDSCFVPTLIHWYENHKDFPSYWQDDILMPVSFALKCFMESWDFTSAIHNAMRCPEEADRHLVGMITGAIAEAMYGCAQCMHKAKEGPQGDAAVWIEFPTAVMEEFGPALRSMREYEHKTRVFFPKNDSRTNVQRQHWTAYRLSDIPLVHGQEFYRRLMKSYVPGWEYRYSVYLDDGWFYVCRSFVLLGRFRMVKQPDSKWKISNVQICSDAHSAQIAFSEVYYALFYRWYRVSEEDEPENMRCCGYYHGEPECPYEPDSAEGRFWHGEMMFITNKQDMEEWQRHSLEFMPSLSGNHMTWFRMLEPHSKALAYYMFMLYSKWRPYDDLEWLMEYRPDRENK